MIYLRHGIRLFLACLFLLSSRNSPGTQESISRVSLNPATIGTASTLRNELVNVAVVRHLIRTYGQCAWSPRVYYVKLVGTHVTPTFLRRFADADIPVRDHKLSYFDGYRVRDKGTHVEGIVFWVKGISWRTSMRAIVSAGYYHDELGGMQSHYLVVHSQRGWIVQKQLSYSVS